MTMTTRVSGAPVTITASKVKVAGVIRTLKTIKAQESSTLRLLATLVPDLTASSSPTTVSGTALLDTPATITTTSCEAVPEGGSGPYSYAWALVSSSGGTTPTILAPSVSTTAFQLAGVANGTIINSVFRCTITDTFGTTAITDVDATFANFGSII